jgi:hypothetical protein
VNSYAPLLWFIQALFLIFVIYPLAKLFLSDLAILLVLLAINEVFGSKYPFFGNALAYMPFFTVGVMVRQSAGSSADQIPTRWTYLVASLVIFTSGCYLEFSGATSFEVGYAFKCLLGVMGSLFIINLSHAIARLERSKIRNALIQMGVYSMTIYLFHPIFESAVRVGFAQLKHWDAPFELVALIAIGVGVGVPMVLEREVLRRYWVTRKFILGLT